jgi:hypothetical protein
LIKQKLTSKKKFRRNYFQQSPTNTVNLNKALFLETKNSLTNRTSYIRNVVKLIFSTFLFIYVSISWVGNSQVLLVDLDSRRSVLIEIFSLAFNNTIINHHLYNSSETLSTVLSELVVYFNILM